MRVLALKALARFWAQHPEAEPALRLWYKVTEKAEWRSLGDLKRTFPSADHLKGETVIFDVSGNHYRISANVVFRAGYVFIRWVMTHREYEKRSKDGSL